MKIAGIIAEYNPFHNGHAAHIRRTRERAGCDAVVVCMSGNITQRGELTCLSKQTRARMALMNGADAVFELPALYACRTADVFAASGVQILGGLGVDLLSFGCEKECAELLVPYSCLLDDESDAFKARVREKLDQGMSHARARGEAAAEEMDVSPALLNRPNAVLGAEYLRALRREFPSVEPVIIERTSGYHDTALSSDASATAIRSAMREGRSAEAAAAVPENVRAFITDAPPTHAPDDIALWCLRNASPEYIRSLPDVAEGLENRLLHAAKESATLDALLSALKCKRYTYARLSRLAAHAMLGLTASLAESHPRPEYARLLGMRADRRDLLTELKHRSGIPIVSDPIALRGDPVFELECRATDLRSLCEDRPELRVHGREFTEKFTRV